MSESYIGLFKLKTEESIDEFTPEYAIYLINGGEYREKISLSEAKSVLGCVENLVGIYNSITGNEKLSYTEPFNWTLGILKEANILKRGEINRIQSLKSKGFYYPSTINNVNRGKYLKNIGENSENYELIHCIKLTDDTSLKKRLRVHVNESVKSCPVAPDWEDSKAKRKREGNKFSRDFGNKSLGGDD